MADPKDTPTAERLSCAHQAYLEDEPRDLFYRIARDMVESALARTGKFTLTEAINVLLFTWNRRRYNRYHPTNAQYWEALKAILDNHREQVDRRRSRSIISFSAERDSDLMPMVRDFSVVLGPVGTAKALHVLAPEFFPPWDHNIADFYGFNLMYSGNIETGLWWPKYSAFMEVRRDPSSNPRHGDRIATESSGRMGLYAYHSR
jgi:hypothetical protein